MGLLDRLVVVEDDETDEVLVDVSSLKTDEEVELLSDEIQARYPVKSIETAWSDDQDPHEMRVFCVERGFLSARGALKVAS